VSYGLWWAMLALQDDQQDSTLGIEFGAAAAKPGVPPDYVVADVLQK